MKQHEHATIIRILDGDEEAYGLLIDRYKEGLYRHCFQFVRDEAMAEDIAQQAFIKAYTNLADFDQQHAFSTWLYKIATNLALGELRKKHALPLDGEAMDLLVSHLPDVHQLALFTELHAAVEQLPDKQKTVVKLHYFKGMPYAHIAKRMRTTTGSVKAWMSRAKSQLKEMLS